MTPSRPAKNNSSAPPTQAARTVYPFAAIVGQEEMKLALLLSVIEPSIGGVLIMGHRGTGKSTAVRALADLLPPIEASRGCPYNCDPLDAGSLCGGCRARLAAEGRLKRERRPVPVVELPLGATEDRVCGTVDFERALKEGVKAYEPGLLARANRGFLYIDEVNLLEDHLVDLLLDASATGRNRVEREGVSAEHPARFVLVGSGNPEEGELRPQLLDRFGLSAEVRTASDLDERVLIVERREAFERDPAAFGDARSADQAALRRRLTRARKLAAGVEVPRPLLRQIARLCAGLGVDGHRGELTITRAARALAAFEGRRAADAGDVRRVAAMSLRHRLRRDPLEQTGGGARIDESVEELFGDGGAGQESEDERGRESEGEAARSRRERSRAGRSSGNDGGGDGGGGGRQGGAGRHERGGEGREASAADERERASGGGDGESDAGGEGRVLPPAEARLPGRAGSRSEKHEKAAGRRPRVSRGGGRGARRNVEGKHGRYVRAAMSKTAGGVVALDATLHAAAQSQAGRKREPASGAPVKVRAGDLRYKIFRRRAGTLYVLAVDTSGSMAVNRIGQAKGALAHLLRESYVKRDSVALVSFRGDGGEVLLRPCNSPARARRILDALPVGGATPLAAGLLRALEVARRARRDGVRRVSLVMFTDGRANVPLGVVGASHGPPRERIRAEIERLGLLLQHEGVEALVVGTRNRYTEGDEGRSLARSLGGRYVHLPPLTAGDAVTDALGPH